MATLNFRDSSNNNLRTFIFTIADNDNEVRTELPQFTSPVTLNTAQISYYDSTDPNSRYVTWRSVNISTQPSGGPNYLNIYPTTGLSLDIWSSTFFNAVNSGNTWNQVRNGVIESFALSTTKTSVLYDYDNKTALYYQKGGNIQIIL